MNCLVCGFKNPMTVRYCQGCGARLDLTADEIQASLIQKKRGEKIDSAEQSGVQALVFGSAALLLGITVFVLVPEAPDDTYFIPSASNGSRYVEVEYTVKKEMNKMPIPVDRATRNR